MAKARILSTLCICLSLSSCATFGRLSALVEPRPGSGSSMPALPPELRPEWKPLAAGVDYAALSGTGLRVEACALRVDLSAKGLEPVMTPLAPTGPGSRLAGPAEGVTRSQHVSSFAREQGCAAAVNASPFDKSTSVEGVELRISGLAIVEGRALSAPLPGKALLVLRHEEGGGFRAEIAVQPEGEGEFDCRGVAAGVGGFFVVLEDGRAAGGARSREPRTAAGVSADGRVLYLLVADGRRKGSAGLTDRETGLWLAWLGAGSGMTLDGGGSSAMAIRGADGIVRIVNVPVHGGRPGCERAVGSCLGFRASPLP